MANRKTTANNESVEKEIMEKPLSPTDTEFREEEKEPNLDTKVTVVNLAGWKVTFTRIQDGIGDVLIAENGRTRLSRNEIIAQVNNGNKLFVGVDGNGSHATLYIDDAPTRRWVGFETKTQPQNVFSESNVKKLFDMTQNEFEKNLPMYIKTRAEKNALVEAIKKLGLNDYRKIMFAVNYCGYKL